MPPRQNARLEAEPNPFQAHRTGGAAPHRPRPYAYPALFHDTEQPRRRQLRGRTEMQTRFGATRADAIADPGIQAALPTRTPLADPSITSGAGSRRIAGTAAGRYRDATGFPQTPDPMVIGLPHPRSEQMSPAMQTARVVQVSDYPIIAQPPTGMFASPPQYVLDVVSRGHSCFN